MGAGRSATSRAIVGQRPRLLDQPLVALGDLAVVLNGLLVALIHRRVAHVACRLAVACDQIMRPRLVHRFLLTGLATNVGTTESRGPMFHWGSAIDPLSL